MYYPLYEENPLLYDYIISAYVKLGNEKGTIDARERFLKDYSEESPWYKENFENEKAMAILNNLNSKHLYDAAVYHHIIKLNIFCHSKLRVLNNPQNFSFLISSSTSFATSESD